MAQDQKHPTTTDTEEQPGVVIAVFVPSMTVQKYADSVGLTKKTVEKQIERGYLPTAKQGRYRMVNIAAMTADLIDQNNK